MPENMKDWNKYNAEITLKVGMIKNFLQFSVTGGFNHKIKTIMKTIKYIALGVLATSMTLVNTSCSDSFLEVENPSGENLEGDDRGDGVLG